MSLYLPATRRTTLSTDLEHFDLNDASADQQVTDLAVRYARDVLALMLDHDDVAALSLAVADDLAALPAWCRVAVTFELACITAHTLVMNEDRDHGAQPLLEVLEMCHAVGLIGPEEKHLLAVWIADVLWAATTGQALTPKVGATVSVDAMRVPFAGAVSALHSRVDSLGALNEYQRHIP